MSANQKDPKNSFHVTSALILQKFIYISKSVLCDEKNEYMYVYPFRSTVNVSYIMGAVGRLICLEFLQCMKLESTVNMEFKISHWKELQIIIAHLVVYRKEVQTLFSCGKNIFIFLNP